MSSCIVRCKSLGSLLLQYFLRSIYNTFWALIAKLVGRYAAVSGGTRALGYLDLSLRDLSGQRDPVPFRRWHLDPVHCDGSLRGRFVRSL